MIDPDPFKDFLAWLKDLVHRNEQLCLESFDFTTFPRWEELGFKVVSLLDSTQAGIEAFEVYEFTLGTASRYIYFGGEYHPQGGMYWEDDEVYEVVPTEVKRIDWIRRT